MIISFLPLSSRFPETLVLTFRSQMSCFQGDISELLGTSNASMLIVSLTEELVFLFSLISQLIFFFEILKNIKFLRHMGNFHTETPVQNTLGSVPTISARTFPHISYVISFLVNPTCWSFVFPGFVTTSYLLYFFFCFSAWLNIL